MITSLVFVFIVSSLTSAIVENKKCETLAHDKEAKYCLLPPYPEHGRYTVRNYPYARPGYSYSSVLLDVSCDIGYLNNSTIKSIFCVKGEWSASMPSCVPDPLACGLITQHRKLEGSSTTHLELPWHAVIYYKSVSYEQCCSGSLITANKIISTAFCFYNYNDELLPASDFMVAVNKMYREHNDPRDINSQQSDVVDIKIPSSYQRSKTNYENNIAIAVVARPFLLHLSVRPVCLNFDNNLDRTQLTEGNFGKAATWKIDRNNDLIRVLNAENLPNIKFEDCTDMLPTSERQYLTCDKFCTGPTNDTRYNNFDRGAGLAFLESTTQRYYLRGVLAYLFENKNHTDLFYTFTSIVKHEHFIKQNL